MLTRSLSNPDSDQETKLSGFFKKGSEVKTSKKYLMELVNESENRIVFSIVIKPEDKFFDRAWNLMGQSSREEIRKDGDKQAYFRIRASIITQNFP
jgi:hypothetical protein